MKRLKLLAQAMFSALDKPMSRLDRHAAILLVALIGCVYLYHQAFPPRLPIETANGTYSNPCCGSLTLENGQMTFENGQLVSYVVQYDKVGRYVLPISYVGVRHGATTEVDWSADPLDLRLNYTAQPTSIDLPSDSETFIFRRVEADSSEPNAPVVQPR